MRIVIEIDGDPPTGRLSAAAPSANDGEEVTDFTGWLGLLHALSEAMDLPPLHQITHKSDFPRLVPHHDHEASKSGVGVGPAQANERAST